MKKMCIVLIALLSLVFVACSKTAENTNQALQTPVKDNSDLKLVKEDIESIILNDEALYEDIDLLVKQYKKILGTYDNTTFLSKYFELKNKFLDSGDSTLISYANSSDFEVNLFFMILKFAIDEGGFKDPSSVKISDFENFEYSLFIRENDINVEKPLSYFTSETADTLYKIQSNGFYLNAKNSFGAYVGNKLVIGVYVYTDSDYVYWYMF